MANISQENINRLAQEASSISDGDYIYIYKSGAGGFARIEKSVFFAGIGNNSGGMSAEVYAAIQANVETLREAYNQLVSDLANLAFTNLPKTSTIAAFSWPDNDGGSGGGDTPTGDPSLTVYVDGVAISSGSTINVGTKTSSSGSVSKTITIKGSNLTSDVSLTMGASTSGLSVTPTSLSASQAMATSGATATISYGGNLPSASGSVTISSGTASVTLSLTASYSEQGGGDEPTGDGVSVTKTLRNITISDNTTNNILAENTAYSGTVAVVDATTMPQKTDGTGTPLTGQPAYAIPSGGVDVKVNGTTVQGAYSNGSISIPAANINGNIAISAVAESPVIIDHKISSGGMKYNSSTAAGWCYNDVFIPVPTSVTHIKWVHYANTAGVNNAYLGIVFIAGSGISKHQAIQVTSSANEQIVEISTSTHSGYCFYVIASFATAQLANCKLVGYTSASDANNDTNGVTLFDGAYATQQELQS